MKFPLSIFFSLFLVLGRSQIIGLSSGINYGRLYDLHIKSNPHFDSEYTGQHGYSFGIEMKDLAFDTVFNYNFAINYQNYGGQFEARNGGLGGSTADKGDITKHIVSLEFYPFCLKIKKHFRLNFGVTYNVLLSHKLTGVRSWWYGMAPGLNTGTISLNDLQNYVKARTWGLNSSIGYEFNFGKITLETRYVFFFGVSNEFLIFQSPAKSMRHSLVLSIGYSLRN